MPLYVYTCNVCKEEEEVLQRYQDRAPIACLNCGAADSMRRNLGTPGLQVKKQSDWTPQTLVSKK